MIFGKVHGLRDKKMNDVSSRDVNDIMRLSAQADSINVPGDNSTASTSNVTVASIFQCQPCGEGLRCPFSSAVENLIRGGAPGAPAGSQGCC